MKIKQKPGVVLDDEEKEIQGAIDRGEFKPLHGKAAAEMKAKLETAARAGVESRQTKDARTNIRIEPADMEAIRHRAQKRGMGYQTLIASVIHMYVNNELLEIGEVKKIAKAGLLKDRI